MAETRTYEGGCHCGAVRYRATTAIERAISCNCSICSKAGTLLAMVPAAQFQLERGADDLGDYQFGRKRIHHHFCKRCGVRSFARGTHPDGTEMVAINLRCVDGVDVASVPVQKFDGASLPMD